MASSRDRQREVERQRHARRIQREQAKLTRRRRRLQVTAAVLAVALVVAGAVAGIAALTGDDNPADVAAAPTPTAGSPLVAGCTVPTTTKPAQQSYPSAPPLTTAKAPYTMTMQTNCGPIVLTLDGKKAPQTVNSLKFLADKGFYDNTRCHRMTTGGSLKVLQCGDPEGTGGGGPGYTLAEENLTGASYPRGTVAMAKTSAPHSTGSQFFLVIGDSELPPEYTVVGRISSGLDTLDKILAAGVEDGSEDGAPAQPVQLTKVTVTKAA